MTQVTGPDRQNRLIFIGAVVMAALAAVFVFAALSNFGGDGDGGGRSSVLGGPVEVVVASSNISPGTTLTGEHLEVVTLPASGIVEGALTERESLEGLRVRYPVAAGEQFTPAKVGQGTGEDNLALAVPPGKRAVAVEIEESSSVGGLIVAGDHVDVIGVLPGEQLQDEEIPSRAVILVQDVEVLAVAQTAQRPVARLDKDGNPIVSDTAEGSLATRPDGDGTDPDAETITLAVNPEDAPLLALAQEEGRIWLALRGFGDGETPGVPPAYLPVE
jgi:pilus assembly protein CpaB